MTVAPEIRDDAFAFFRDFVHARSAIVLSDEKRYLVETRLSPVARRAGLAGLDDLVRAMRARRDPDLETAVLDAMTTNETSFFRDRTPFDALRERVLPDRIAANAPRRRLAIWSAACSTGQEPYSVAMLLDTAFPELGTWQVDVLGTDISTTALARAREGRFSALEVDRGLPAPHLVTYFTRDGADFRLADRLRSRVRFEPINLAQPWPHIARKDVIMLRNVLIYFDAPTRLRILAGIRGRLRPGGYLLLGAAEATRDLVQGFVPVQVAGTTVYKLEEV